MRLGQMYYVLFPLEAAGCRHLDKHPDAAGSYSWDTHGQNTGNFTWARRQQCSTLTSQGKMSAQKSVSSRFKTDEERFRPKLTAPVLFGSICSPSIWTHTPPSSLAIRKRVEESTSMSGTEGCLKDCETFGIDLDPTVDDP